MSFSARLGTDDIAIEAGATTLLTVEITNNYPQAAEFEISVEGLDGEWVAIPVALSKIPAGATANEKIFLKPSRTSESTAGSYPYVVNVRSFEDNEVKTLQSALTIKPYHHLSLELTPKKGFISAWKHANEFETTLINLGNATHTVQFLASDPEDACAFEFDDSQIQLEPGQQKSTSITVNPRSKRFFTGKLFGFSVSARSIEVPNIVAIGQAQLEQKPTFSLGTLIPAFIVILAIAAWVALIPRPPEFTLKTDKTSGIVGQPIVIQWTPTTSDEHVKIFALNAVIYDGPGNVGQISYVPTVHGTINITGTAEKNNHSSDPQSLSLNITDPPVIPDPVISEFKLDETKLAVNQPVTIHYKVENATKIVLLPLGKELDPTINEFQIVADNINTHSYTLRATNSANKSVQKTVDVTISQPSKAAIIAFTADQTKLAAPGPVTLTWQTNSLSIRVELSDGTQTQVEPSSGTTSIVVNHNTTFKITAFDDQGISITKTVRVVILPPPAPTTPPAVLPPTPTAGSSTAGSGTSGQNPPNDGGSSGGTSSTAGTTGTSTTGKGPK